MSVIITSGTLICNKGKTSVAITKADGPQTFSKELEARLVSEGVAIYVDKPTVAKDTANKKDKNRVATAPKSDKAQDAGDYTPDKENGSEGKGTAFEYNADMKASELRELLGECGLTYKVGMSKVDMVAALDAYFEEDADDTEQPPDIGAEEPVV